MSRVGNRIITLPEGVEINLIEHENDTIVKIKGPKGELIQHFLNLIKIKIDNKQLQTIRPNEQKFTKSYHGTVNSIINGMIKGVVEGYEVNLEIIGVGYKATMQGNKLVLNLGFSHPIEVVVPQGIIVATPKPTEIKIFGIDKQFVTQFAAKIYLIKKPEPYGGKGIRYKGQIVKKKAGKAAGGK